MTKLYKNVRFITDNSVSSIGFFKKTVQLLNIIIGKTKRKRKEIQKRALTKLPVSIKLFLYKGNKYFCPFCNYSARNLFPKGRDLAVLKEKKVIGGCRRICGCHKCGSTDRERLVYAYLNHVIKIFSSEKIKSILHIAPEANLSKKLLDFGFEEYICGDLLCDGYTYPAHVKKINIIDIPYSDNTFDLIICNHVLEHIPADLVAMKELQRVLKKGGKAILQVPISQSSENTFEDFSVTDPEQRKIIFGQFDHVRIYGQDYSKRLEQSGFKVNRINISKDFLKYGLNKDEDVFVCEK